MYRVYKIINNKSTVHQVKQPMFQTEKLLFYLQGQVVNPLLDHHEHGKACKSSVMCTGFTSQHNNQIKVSEIKFQACMQSN